MNAIPQTAIDSTLVLCIVDTSKCTTKYETLATITAHNDISKTI